MKVFDAHCDYLYCKSLKNKSKLEDKIDFEYKSVFAVFEGNKTNTVEEQINIFNNESLPAEAKIAFEGLSWVTSQNINTLINAEPFYVGPVWNNANGLCGSCNEDFELTKRGKEVLAKINSVIDTAHCGKKAFYSIFDNFENVIFSHGNVYSIKKHRRNLTDNQIKLIIDRNSFFGLSFYKDFVGGDTIENLIKNIDYVLDLGGEDILGFGSDFDGCEDIIGSGNLNVFADIYEEMLKRNYSYKVIDKIFYKNLERIEINIKNSKKTVDK